MWGASQNADPVGGTHAETTVLRLVVLGAGVAGLSAARRCGADLVLEASRRVGGRIRTIRAGGGDGDPPLYEAGPWRVHSSHARTLALLREFGLQTRVASSSAAGRQIRGGALSVHGEALLRRGVAAARREELESGYEGFQVGPRRTYHTRHPATGSYHVVHDGLQALAERMADAVGRDRIRLNCRVVDVRFDGHAYHVTCRERVGHAQFVTTHVTTRTLICAVPPRVGLDWTVARRWLNAPLRSVGTLPLCHVYGRLRHVDTGAVVRVPALHLVLPASRLGQVISGDGASGDYYFQVSYTGGRRAQFWERLRRSSPTQFRATLQRDVREALREHVADVDRCELVDVRSHYWPHAVHHWRPAFGFPADVAGSVRLARRCCGAPHPVRLPGLRWCGEAFSASHQGWIEGALETVDYVMDDVPPSAPASAPAAATTMVLEGRRVDVTAWKTVHPGSEAAITSHVADPDATSVFTHLGHSDEAWATVNALQVGFVSLPDA